MINFKAGKYYVGDLCYVIDDVAWQALCKRLEADGYFESDGGKWTGRCNGSTIVLFSTLNGDGSYYDQYSRQYLVDSGNIGIMPVDVISKGDADGGNIIEFETDFAVEAVDKGVFAFGNIVVDTSK